MSSESKAGPALEASFSSSVPWSSDRFFLELKSLLVSDKKLPEKALGDKSRQVQVICADVIANASLSY